MALYNSLNLPYIIIGVIGVSLQLCLSPFLLHSCIFYTLFYNTNLIIIKFVLNY